jgi:O-glycosyl hydrolase
MVNTRKPIMVCVGNKTEFTYKYIRTAYAVGVPIKFHTDLNEKEWEKMFDGINGKWYTAEEIERFETTGSFEKVD